MARGRPPDPAAIVTRLAGSLPAQQRLDLMLQSLTGKVGIPQASAWLGLGRSRFCLLRQEMLRAALATLEPKTRGRPPLQNTPQEQQIALLQQQVQALKVDLRAAQIREELALLMPHVLQRNKIRRKKNTQTGRPSRQRGGTAPRPAPRPNTPADRGDHE